MAAPETDQQRQVHICDVSLNLVHIHTGEGVSGVGWGGGTASGQGSDLTTTLIDYFKPVVIGEDP